MKRNTLIWAGGLAALAAGVLLAKQAHGNRPPVTTVPDIDLRRYSGQWHEIARFPNRFQKKCVSDVTATYRQRDDGRIDVTNRCRTADGSFDEVSGIARQDRSRAAQPFSNAKLEVLFAPRWLGWLPVAWGRYWVVMLDADYEWAVVSEPRQRYLWILARHPNLSADTYRRIERDLAGQGYDVRRLQTDANAVGSAAAQPAR
ncbi:apolipoprotein D and lipocalin family protein [Chitinasiproducens palmae]|uniref:Outer membrane lipoprotein Blc n=1 Tax=Chitinasiproducens palmae TaxID=1770053 RepID=A0A1H2PPD4_9BURK|nr:apolipoprotein D and lipocalin family protein [Chitinasiproducens palmae]